MTIEQLATLAIESQPAPCPPHTPGTSGEWAGRCTKCGTPC